MVLPNALRLGTSTESLATKPDAQPTQQDLEDHPREANQPKSL